MIIRLICLLTIFNFFALAGSGADQHLKITASLQSSKTGENQLSIQVAVPPGFKLYADQFKVEIPSQLKIIPLSLPVPQDEEDAYSGEQKLVYNRSFTAVYLVENLTNETISIKVHHQGCDQKVCFLPATEEIKLKVDKLPERLNGGKHDADLSGNVHADWPQNIKRDYKVAATQSGYLNEREFLSFLDLSGRQSAEPGSIRKTWRLGKFWISALLMILGGLALNLTPCVLPLIPVNLAIIGAGVRAASVPRGFLLGTVYGLGIVLAYGVFGLTTVLTGAQFGSINASPWFNLGVAILFLVLGLALFDVIMIDLSRFQTRFKIEGKGLIFVLFMGVLSALLAGACVAPVVIAVLLLASDIYLQGQVVGLVLPFFLGFGMALPWPFAGAGLSFLPKPGRWMARIKHIFAVIIMLAGLHYFLVSARMFYGKYKISGEPTPGSQTDGNWLMSPDGLSAEEIKELSAGHRKPILIYFWASWCKNCQAMNVKTFASPLVRKKMDEFVCLKYQAEDPQDDSTRAVLREFGVIGLPTFVILTPIK
jgi:thiol:disulfide interchange protein